MELDGARTLVIGATGVLGGKLSRALHDEGARLVIAGRDRDRLARLAEELGDCPTEQFDALGPFGAAPLLDRAVDLRDDLTAGEVIVR